MGAWQSRSLHVEQPGIHGRVGGSVAGLACGSDEGRNRREGRHATEGCRKRGVHQVVQAAQFRRKHRLDARSGLAGQETVAEHTTCRDNSFLDPRVDAVQKMQCSFMPGELFAKSTKKMYLFMRLSWSGHLIHHIVSEHP